MVNGVEPVELNPNFMEDLFKAAAGKGIIIYDEIGGTLEPTATFGNGKTSRSLLAVYQANFTPQITKFSLHISILRATLHDCLSKSPNPYRFTDHSLHGQQMELSIIMQLNKCCIYKFANLLLLNAPPCLCRQFKVADSKRWSISEEVYTPGTGMSCP